MEQKDVFQREIDNLIKALEVLLGKYLNTPDLEVKKSIQDEFEKTIGLTVQEVREETLTEILSRLNDKGLSNESKLLTVDLLIEISASLPDNEKNQLLKKAVDLYAEINKKVTTIDFGRAKRIGEISSFLQQNN